MRGMMRSVIIFLLFALYETGRGDEIDLEVHTGRVLKMLREMANKTNASESLNLPANASSIRENITDTFSCENRTYGYYADVDNECQVFHVCLPTQTPSGRNITYRWSFICPNETIFNQEVLTCTRPRDSIPCEDSPDYYDLNMEIGKVTKDDTKDPKISEDKQTRNKLSTNEREKQNAYTNERERNVAQRRRQDNRKQNIIMDNLFKEIVNEEMKEKLQAFEFGDNVDEIFPEVITDEVLEENGAEVLDNKEDIAMTVDELEDRLALERSMGETNGKRRSFRFKADV